MRAAAVAVAGLLIYLTWKSARGAEQQQGQTPTTAAPAASVGASFVADINAVAEAEGVPAAVLYAITATEQGSSDPSQWNANAVNLSDPYGGAWGLTQVLAATGADLGVPVPQELLDPVESLTTTARYLRRYSPNVDSITDDAQVYNAGPNATTVDAGYIARAKAYYQDWYAMTQGAA
ncbi:MAG: lytic transglycosylase domain-containing protein [Acidiferrobacter sp.]